MTATSRKTSKKQIYLALQGGGAHGAFTWGVLDRLLEDDRIEIAGFSGASAGAMNAVIAAHGLATGGPEQARNDLKEFWRGIAGPSAMMPFSPGLWAHIHARQVMEFMSGYAALDILRRLIPPYLTNPLNLDPLRDRLADSIDFNVLRDPKTPPVYVSATNVSTGIGRVFGPEELQVDHLAASACLPLVFQAVEIDGESYWDGGYSLNPALDPLVGEGDRDLVAVLLNPEEWSAKPHSAIEINARINHLAFHNSFLKAAEKIELMNTLAETGQLSAKAKYKPTRLHSIAANEIEELSVSSRVVPDWGVMKELRDLGRQRAEEWLEAHLGELGKVATFHVGDPINPPTVNAKSAGTSTATGKQTRRGKPRKRAALQPA